MNITKEEIRDYCENQEFLEEIYPKPVICGMSFRGLKEEFADSDKLRDALSEIFMKTIFSQLESNAITEIINEVMASDKLDGFNDWAFMLKIGVMEKK